ncbi:MAG: succinyl-diaminopimelate desuccinylase [Actinobacteria bacterium]|jgi:succinyl-diaminopimelate desuccinylase|nr:succinyl-diaminopimelate desuccinylase [Actinomycetota bacterium]
MGGTTDLDLTAPLPTLLQQLIDIPSESRHEQVIADAVHDALRGCDHLVLDRIGHNIVARTQLGRAERVVIGGHVDTVPENRNMPSSRAIVDGQDRVMGLGACDMKGGVAVLLQLAATLREPTRDVTWVLYEAEEIDARFNGLRLLAEQRPELLESSFAVLMEPSNAVVEAGCQGTMRVEVRTTGVRSHSARSWMGHNAIHDAVDVLARLRDYEPRQVEIDGLTYREGLNAVRIRGGVAGNVIPDECVVEVNYRFAPSRSGAEAEAHLREVFDGFDVVVADLAEGALPGLSQPAAQAFVAAVGGTPSPKFGWTDVARFSALGIPAVNYGPGDPSLAHTQAEYCPVDDLDAVERGLRAWLTS